LNYTRGNRLAFEGSIPGSPLKIRRYRCHPWRGPTLRGTPRPRVTAAARRPRLLGRSASSKPNPASSAWEAEVLPLNYTRIDLCCLRGFDSRLDTAGPLSILPSLAQTRTEVYAKPRSRECNPIASKPVAARIRRQAIVGSCAAQRSSDRRGIQRSQRRQLWQNASRSAHPPAADRALPQGRRHIVRDCAEMRRREAGRFRTPVCRSGPAVCACRRASGRSRWLCVGCTPSRWGGAGSGRFPQPVPRPPHPPQSPAT